MPTVKAKSKSKAHTLSFKPKQVTKRLVAVLPDRARDVIVKRYGLESDEKMTLEAIGKKYDITRERVRQIENYAIANILKADAYKKEMPVFDEVEALMHKLGGVIAEEDFLEIVSDDRSVQNHVHFLLVIGEAFKRRKEDDHFKHRWYVDEAVAKDVDEALRKVYENLPDDALMPESEIIGSFMDHLKNMSEQFRDEEIVKRWLSISKKISKNPLGEWGQAHSSNIKLKGIRDYAYLVIRQHGSPMHFTEVASKIKSLFDKRAHVATTHNELIKDSRFVLVGRGLYALSEWGYMNGVVRDVIREVLKKNGALTREEVVEKVLKERYVKTNTILVNLQDPKYFKRDKEGRYTLA